MPLRPPNDDDPTDELEPPTFDGARTDQFDGTRTDQLYDTYRVSVVTAGESGSGASTSEDRGLSLLKWIAKLGLVAIGSSETFNQVKAPENTAPTLEGHEKPQPEAEPLRKVGYDPYDTAVLKKPK